MRSGWFVLSLMLVAAATGVMVFAGVFMTTPERSHACSCGEGEPTPVRDWLQADAVFTGTIVSFTYFGEDHVDVVEIDVDWVYKGWLPPTTYMMSGSSTCGLSYNAVEGGRWLFYANEDAGKDTHLHGLWGGWYCGPSRGLRGNERPPSQLLLRAGQEPDSDAYDYKPGALVQLEVTGDSVANDAGERATDGDQDDAGEGATDPDQDDAGERATDPDQDDAGEGATDPDQDDAGEGATDPDQDDAAKGTPDSESDGTGIGWNWLHAVYLPVIGLLVAIIAWLTSRRRRAFGAESP